MAFPKINDRILFKEEVIIYSDIEMKTEGSLTLKYDPIRKQYFPKSLPRELEVLDYDFIGRSDLLRIETIMWMLFGKEGAKRTQNYAQRSEIFESELGRFKIYLEIEKGILEALFFVFEDICYIRIQVRILYASYTVSTGTYLFCA